MHLATIKPNRISIRYTPDVRFSDAPRHILDRRIAAISKKNLSSPKKSVNLSKASQRNIRDSIMLLYELSKPRKVQVKKDTFIFNFRASFITLTLPSAQVHSDVEIKKCLNSFLVNCRRYLGVNNYVWKAELQKNANIHFHLTFDKYCSYNAIRYYWNQAISHLGYIFAYSAKMSALSLSQYASLRQLPVEKCRVAYARGVKSKWSTPNSVDVKSIRSTGALSFYLAKYLSKSSNELDDTERIAQFGKVWARSQSLSKIKLITRYDWTQMKSFIIPWLKKSTKVKEVISDWCTTFYFKISELPYDFRCWIQQNLIRQATYFHYPFPY